MAVRRFDWVSAWGVGGVILLLLWAVVRLAPKAWVPLSGAAVSLELGLAYAASVVFMAYSEGYRGFQRAFSPRVVRRSFELPRRWPFMVGAPLVAMGLFHAGRRRRRVARIMTVTMIGLVLLVRRVPQPYRGIIDAGVVVGLLWGVATLLYFFVGACRGRLPGVDPEWPEVG